MLSRQEFTALEPLLLSGSPRPPDRLLAWAAHLPSWARAQPEPRSQPPATPNVLIADDDDDVVQVVRDVLSESGCLVQAVGDGERAVEMAAAQPPDLMLLDLAMPGLDGFEVCERLGQNSALPWFPIVVLSASASDDAMRRAFELGAVDYLTKPFVLAQLRSRVETWLLRAKAWPQSSHSAPSC